MRLAEVRKYAKHEGPDDNEERYDQEQNLPLGNRHCPQETPITTVGLKYQRQKEETRYDEQRYALH